MVSGIITNPVNDMVSFIYSDTSYSTSINDNGEFNIIFSRDSSDYLSFKHGNETTTMFLNPGEKVFLSIDPNEFDESIYYKGSSQSSYLAYKYLTNEEKDFFGQALYLKNQAEYQTYVDEYEKITLYRLEKFDDGYFKNTELQYLSTSIDKYLKQKQNLSKRSKEELSYMWDARVISQEYNVYELLKSSSQSQFKKALISYEEKMMTSLKKVDSIDFLEEEKEKIASLISKWKERKNDYDNMPKIGDQAINFSYPNQNNDNIELISFKGKMVFVDVWATWCGPCIAEIPYLKNLQNDYSDKDIVFLSISVDTDRDAWSTMLSNDGLSGVQLWADGWSDITRSYAIFSIPRFLLIDKEGKIISVDAPRPSSTSIRPLIDEHI
ncbi:MAG: TlpA family protein disulfide reductase [Candidatus Neomarinimicrobiota bacterium]